MLQPFCFDWKKAFPEIDSSKIDQRWEWLILTLSFSLGSFAAVFTGPPFYWAQLKQESWCHWSDPGNFILWWWREHRPTAQEALHVHFQVWGVARERVRLNRFVETQMELGLSDWKALFSVLYQLNCYDSVKWLLSNFSQSLDLPAFHRASAKRPGSGLTISYFHTCRLCSPLPPLHPRHSPRRYAEWVTWLRWLLALLRAQRDC